MLWQWATPWLWLCMRHGTAFLISGLPTSHSVAVRFSEHIRHVAIQCFKQLRASINVYMSWIQMWIWTDCHHQSRANSTLEWVIVSFLWVFWHEKSIALHKQYWVARFETEDNYVCIHKSRALPESLRQSVLRIVRTAVTVTKKITMVPTCAECFDTHPRAFAAHNELMYEHAFSAHTTCLQLLQDVAQKYEKNMN